jgi:membrane associated rhomboid family serine protease
MKPTERYQLELREFRTSMESNFLRALKIIGAALVLFTVIFLAQRSAGTPDHLTLHPQSMNGLIGVFTAPLLHADMKHLVGNLMGIGILGVLAFTIVPRATVRALPLVWLGAGLGTWFLGRSESAHLGASGVTHGLAFLLFTLMLYRRDRSSIAAFFVAFFFFGGMLLTVFPREWNVSWEYHLSGAVFGFLAALLFRKLDQRAPEPRYSWDDDAEAELDAIDIELELPRPEDVPVLWHRQEASRGQVLPFQRPAQRSTPSESSPAQND